MNYHFWNSSGGVIDYDKKRVKEKLFVAERQMSSK